MLTNPLAVAPNSQQQVPLCCVCKGGGGERKGGEGEGGALTDKSEQTRINFSTSPFSLPRFPGCVLVGQALAYAAALIVYVTHSLAALKATRGLNSDNDYVLVSVDVDGKVENKSVMRCVGGLAG